MQKQTSQKPYALYIHGLGSSAKSGTKQSFGKFFTEYEWLTPELSNDPYESLDIINQWVETFQPEMIAGTSMGGMLCYYANVPLGAIKLMVNPVIEMETALRKIGYGKHPYLQERENGEKEYVIDEPMIRRFIQFRKEHEFVDAGRNIALFSSHDELIGPENTRKNMNYFDDPFTFEVLMSDKFGHRANERAIKEIVKYLEELK